MHKITFQTFLSGTPARDYIFQKTPYEEQIMQAADMIQKADYVLMGAGAGLSTAAGAVYGGTWFEKNFKEFKEKYGNGPYMQDMYSAGFHPYPDEESFWSYWSKQAILGGIDLDVTPLYKDILKLLKDKRTFCLSTNADGQFQKAGYKKNRFSAPREITSTSNVKKPVTKEPTTQSNFLNKWTRQEKTAKFQPTWCQNVQSAADQ